MVIVETDFIVAVSSASDARHDETVRILRRNAGKLKLSPYTLIELDLLVKSGRLIVNLPAYYESLSKLLEFYGISLVEPNPVHLAIAWELRRKYALTYFDSLHAAVAIAAGEPLASYDEIYRRVKELKHIHPSSLA